MTQVLFNLYLLIEIHFEIIDLFLTRLYQPTLILPAEYTTAELDRLLEAINDGNVSQGGLKEVATGFGLLGAPHLARGLS